MQVRSLVLFPLAVLPAWLHTQTVSPPPEAEGGAEADEGVEADHAEAEHDGEADIEDAEDITEFAASWCRVCATGAPEAGLSK